MSDELTIRTSGDVMTLVNVFTVAPERQEELVETLVRAADGLMSRMDGFIAASIHRGADGTHVINYAQWRSREHFEAMRRNAEVAPHMAKVASIAQFEPVVCEVVHVRGG